MKKIEVDWNVVDYAKTHTKKETLLYNNRIYAGYVNASQQRKDEYSVNREWILAHFAPKLDS